MLPSVYAYNDPRLYLRDVLEHKRQSNPLFSLRAWAKQMGFRCHSSLVYLLNGTRPLRTEHLDRLNRGLRLQEPETNYFRALIEFATSRTETERDFLAQRLKLLEPNQEEAQLDVERFKLIADWVHMALLEMTRLRDFKADPDWIARRLAFPVTPHTIAEALQRLTTLGLLEEKDGKLVKTQARLTTPSTRGSESIREHHRQVLANASRAVDEQAVTERALNSCTLTIDSKRLPEAQALILKFRAEMAKLLETDQGDQTYQLSVQLFKLTNEVAT